MTEPKKKSVAIWLAILLGGIGAHRFYLRQFWQGALYAAFCWAFYIPGIIALFEIPFLGRRVERFNERHGTR